MSVSRVALLGAAVSLVVVVACGSSDGASEPPPAPGQPPPPSGPPQPPTGQAGGAGQPQTAAGSGQQAPPAPAAPAAPLPSPEQRLRTEFEKWKSTPFRQHGTSHEGIDGPGLVRAMVHNALGLDVPATYERQFRTGKLVERDALAPGDLVFFEGTGFGPFRARWVGLYLGKEEAALAHKDAGVTVVKLSDARWKAAFKTARRLPTDPNLKPPAFDVGKYGTNRAALLREIAEAWSGTLYRQNGTTFDGIGNHEFVREVYEAIHEEELTGNPSKWDDMGEGVGRDDLEPGDIILYQAVGLGSLFNQRHAGIYLGDGDFVHSVKGAAVTISQLEEPRWQSAFRMARRIDPETLDRVRAARAAARATPKPSTPATGARGMPPPEPAPPPAVTAPAAPPAPKHSVTVVEQRLRDAIQPWYGTPYKIGGTSKSGVDCSAFTRAVFEAAFRFQLPRTAEEQERLGNKIDRRSLQTGDLVFFRTQGMGPFFRSRHVGVYLGGGEFAHASGKKGVTISRLDNSYWNKKYATARRLAVGGQ
jgi:cell wall-associated NlpC family hydrolase